MEWWKIEENLSGSEGLECSKGVPLCEACVLAYRVCATLSDLTREQHSSASAIVLYWLDQIKCRYGLTTSLLAYARIVSVLEGWMRDEEVAVHVFDVCMN